MKSVLTTQKTSQNEPEGLDRAIDVAAAMAIVGTLNKKTENFSEKIIQWIGKELMKGFSICRATPKYFTWRGSSAFISGRVNPLINKKQ